MGFPVIPEILRNANWQKEKGKFAKIFGGETGIGAQMDKLKAAVEKLDLIKTNVASTYKSLADVDAAIKDCKAELAKTEPIRKEAYALRDLGNKVAADFKKNKLIPAASAAHVESVAKAADVYGVSVKSYDPTKDFEEAKKKIQERLNQLMNMLKGLIGPCAQAVAKLKTGKATAEQYHTDAWQKVRGVAAAIAQHPDHFKAVHGEWKVLSSVTKDKLKDVPAVTKHINAVDALIKKTTPLIG